MLLPPFVLKNIRCLHSSSQGSWIIAGGTQPSPCCRVVAHPGENSRGVGELSCIDLVVHKMDIMVCYKPALAAEMAVVLGHLLPAGFRSK